MKNIFFICVFSLIAFTGCTDDDELYKNSGGNSTEEESTLPNEDIELSLFEALNLDYPGLEQVKAWYETGNYYSAAKALLTYYKGRIGITNPNVSLLESTITANEQLYADYAMDKYRFYVNTNYLEDKTQNKPWSLQNEDKTINWNFNPPKADQEYQKQLHRHYWMPYQGKAYQKSNDEKYILSWKEVYTDWVLKNPKPETPNETTWWQLQVSTRIIGQTELFDYFKFSPNFTPEWLSFFLAHFAEHADYLAKFRYQDENNILLSQGTALAFAGTLFPEFKNAAKWQEMGFNILNEQAPKQCLEDGMFNDLSLHYHIGTLDEFYNIKRLIDQNQQLANLLSPQIYERLEEAAELVMHFTFPNYFNTNKNEFCTSALNDSWMKQRDVLKRNFIKYSEMFPSNQELRFMATMGAEGTRPSTDLKAFEASGHYILRNSWGDNGNYTQATVLIHSNNYLNETTGDWSHKQLDNGTFELYHNGRNFFPDSGVCTYMGNGSTIKELRQWFRSTKAHNTMTLGDGNIQYTLGKRVEVANSSHEVIVTQNPSYDNFTHRRSIFFVNKNESNPFFVLVDEGFGTATGTTKLYFHLGEQEADVDLDKESNGAHTKYNDGNNLVVRSFGSKEITSEEFEGRFATKTDQSFTARKAYSVNMEKDSDTPVRYITVIYPTTTPTEHSIKANLTDMGKDILQGISVKIEIDSQTYNLEWNS
ncbi:heparin-sulfate lyase HepC [Bacteroides zhangwenhongii]|jgi:hypothetical protein|uniref:heparin-sulfate lyase HepC n=1 Tax=Bacteroides zhangwenhongii TaxID=2650157 RepID=UPI0022E12269|nr:heparin-sulfate lyase HepC [Bacteroides zhangwenhongii]